MTATTAAGTTTSTTTSTATGTTTGTTTRGGDGFDHDVVVVGGGAAGLSAAKALLRSRRSVLVLDAGQPRNSPAEGVHNLLGLEDVSPLELLRRGRAEVASYGGTVREATATTARRERGGFVVGLSGGEEVSARRLVVTTGLVDVLPEVPGVAERWGGTVLHCPFCHGWEVRDQRIGVLGTGPASVHQALMFSRLSDQVVLVTHDARLEDADHPRLEAAGVRVHDGRVAALEGEPLTGARLEDGTVLPLDALVVASWMRAASPVLDALGLRAEPHASGLGEHYPSEVMGATTVPGLRLAGNVTDLAAQVGAAASAGVMAGAATHGELIEADLSAVLGAGTATRA